MIKNQAVNPKIVIRKSVSAIEPIVTQKDTVREINR